MFGRATGSLLGLVALAVALATMSAPPSSAAAVVAAPAGSADLSISAPEVKHVKPGRWVPVKVTIANQDTDAVGNVRLQLSGAGIKLKSTSVDYGTLSPGASATRTVRVRVAGKNERLLTYGITADVTSYAYASTRLLPIYKRKAPVTGKYQGRRPGGR